ncbi:hypothetical protein C8R43DRAFT_1037222 [Mycena crocata]|nr:hypothetical protein C8R43DRAFT_1037222 [Mycena crocata]
MDAHTPEPLSPPNSEVVNGGGGDSAQTETGSRGSAVRHLAILGSFLIPIAFVPYMMTRRQVASLRRRVDEMGATTAFLRQRYIHEGLAHAAQARTGEEAASSIGTTTLLTQLRQEIDALREQLEHKDVEHSKALTDMAMDVINNNEELGQLRTDLLSVRDISSASSNTATGEELGKLGEGLQRLRKETHAAVTESSEQIRLLRGDQEAMRTELIKLSGEFIRLADESAKTGPQVVDSAELHRLLKEARQTRYNNIVTAFSDVSLFIQCDIWGDRVFFGRRCNNNPEGRD